MMDTWIRMDIQMDSLHLHLTPLFLGRYGNVLYMRRRLRVPTQVGSAASILRWQLERNSQR